MAYEYVAVESCARCGGHFPGPGLGVRGRVYCCDRCAAEGEGLRTSWTRWTLTRVLPVAALMFGAGRVSFMAGSSAGRVRLLSYLGAASAMWAGWRQSSRLAARAGAYLCQAGQGRLPYLGERAMSVRELAKTVGMARAA